MNLHDALSGDQMVIPVKCTDWKPDSGWLDFAIGTKLYFDFSVKDAEQKNKVRQKFLQGMKDQ